MSSLSISRADYELTIFLANSLWTILFEICLWIHYQIINSTISSLSLSSIHGEFTIFSQIHYEFDYEFIIDFLIWLWIHYLFRDLTINSLFFCKCTIVFFRSWKNYELTIYFVIWRWIYCLLNEIIMNSLYLR